MHVLVADARATVREGATQALQDAGYRVSACIDGLSAYQVGVREGFDAAFVAWDLPELDGLELFSLWQQQPALHTRPVVMVVQPEHQDQARLWLQLCAAGRPPWDMLMHPFAPRLLVDVLESLRT